MRTVGLVALLLGLLVAVGGALAPISVAEGFGTTFSCGPGVLNVAERTGGDQFSQPIYHECAVRARERLIYLGPVSLLLVAGGIVVLTIGSQRATPAPGWYPSPDGAPVLRWWDGHAWTAHTRPTEPPR